MTTILLESADGVQYEIDSNAAQLSGSIRGFIEDVGLDPDMTIPLPEVNSMILEKVIQYLEVHQNDLPREEEPTSTYISPEDQAILGINPDGSFQDRAMVYDLIRAANYLEIQPLLKVTTRAVANQLRGKNVEQMRAVLGIRN